MMGSINQAGMISTKRLWVSNLPKYKAGAAKASTAAWLVDWGMHYIFELRFFTALENWALETTVKSINSEGRMPLPIVPAVFLPAIKAPTNTIIPKSPGMIDFLITLAP